MKQFAKLIVAIIAVIIMLAIPFCFHSAWYFLVSWIPALFMVSIFEYVEWPERQSNGRIKPSPYEDATNQKRWCSRLMQPCGNGCSAAKCKNMDDDRE